MSAIPWLDQRAAVIRDMRQGEPHAPVTVNLAQQLTGLFPHLTATDIGAVTLAIGLAVTAAAVQLSAMGDVPDLPTITGLIETTGEYLYAPPTTQDAS